MHINCEQTSDSEYAEMPSPKQKRCFKAARRKIDAEILLQHIFILVDCKPCKMSSHSQVLVIIKEALFCSILLYSPRQPSQVSLITSQR